MEIFKNIKFFILFLAISALLSGCGKVPKLSLPDLSVPAIEPNARKRAQQNVIDGKGIQILPERNKSSNFLFASSNPMWKAALETLSFISIASSDYSGGVLITDWYSEDNPNEAIKITIRFLSNEIRADGMVINLYKRNCVNNVCSTKEIKSDLIFDIKDKIIKKAALYYNQDVTAAKKNRPVKQFSGDNE